MIFSCKLVNECRDGVRSWKIIDSLKPIKISSFVFLLSGKEQNKINLLNLEQISKFKDRVWKLIVLDTEGVLERWRMSLQKISHAER